MILNTPIRNCNSKKVIYTTFLESIADEMSKVTPPKIAATEYAPPPDIIKEPKTILSEAIEKCQRKIYDLPKGLNQLTLKQIVAFLRDTYDPVSAERVAEGVSLTRVTVRRYLEFLEQCGVLTSELKYGTVGRPVKLFKPVRE